MGPIWGVTMNAKNHRLLWDPICGYYNELKISDYYGTLYADIAMNVKTSDYYGILYAGIAMNVKTNDYYKILYAGIALSVNN